MQHSRHAGFTLLTTLIGAAILALLGVAAYSVSAASVRALRVYREKSSVAALADQYMEIAHNLPYSRVGTINGNPPGSLPDLPNALHVVYNNTPYQLYYVVNYIDDPADGTVVAGTDSQPNDYKQVKLYIENTVTGLTIPFVTNIVPKGLESMASGGALSLKVFNAVGQPVPDAHITITNSSTTPGINLARTADASGNWVEVGLPDSVNSYHVVVTKNAYSTDQTYPSAPQNPNPTKPDATISNGQVTQVSFSIDQLSSLTLNTVNQTCLPLPGIGLELRGSKLIGTPSVYKFDTTYTTNDSGQVGLSTLEWDNYTPAPTSPSYMIYGSSPIQQINLLPNTSQSSTLILGPTTSNSLLMIVKDASSGNALEGATVELKNVDLSYDTSKMTGGSVLYQEDWSGGAGQADFSTADMYYLDDGNVDAHTLPAGLRLAKVLGSYALSGSLTSSSFDTGTASSSFTTLFWNPTSQSPSTTIAFQIATNNDDGTWDYTGPDGTSLSYYATPGTTINAANSNHRYLRYKVLLGTTDTSTTPVLSNVTVNYVSGCFAPGQAMFVGLQSSATYQVIISLAGYQTQTLSDVTINGYNVLQVQLSH